MKRSTKSRKRDLKPVPKRTQEEQALVDTFRARKEIPRVKLVEGKGADKGKRVVAPDTEDPQLWAAQLAAITGVSSLIAMEDVLSPLSAVAWKVDGAQALNGGLGLLQEIAPRDGLEGMLATQMVTTHRVAMEQLRRAMITEQSTEGVDLAINRATKLMRTFTKQMEALGAHRGKTSQQRVEVKHVHVYPGAQAVVGNVAQGGGGQQQEGREPHAKETLTYAPEPALRSQDAAADAVPVTGNAKRAL